MGKNSSDSPLTFRAPAKNRQQLTELRRLWGDQSLSRVITRCIEWAWLVEVGKDRIGIKPSEVDIEEEEIRRNE